MSSLESSYKDKWTHVHIAYGGVILGLRLQLRKDTEARFREAAMRRFGFGKGALSRAAEQAIEAWLSSNEPSPKFEGDPVKAIQGMLRGSSKGSVELQHSAKETWTAKVLHDASD